MKSPDEGIITRAKIEKWHGFFAYVSIDKTYFFSEYICEHNDFFDSFKTRRRHGEKN